MTDPGGDKRMREQEDFLYGHAEEEEEILQVIEEKDTHGGPGSEPTPPYVDGKWSIRGLRYEKLSGGWRWWDGSGVEWYFILKPARQLFRRGTSLGHLAPYVLCLDDAVLWSQGWCAREGQK